MEHIILLHSDRFRWQKAREVFRSTQVLRVWCRYVKCPHRTKNVLIHKKKIKSIGLFRWNDGNLRFLKCIHYLYDLLGGSTVQHKVCALWQLQRMAVNGQKYVNGQSPGIFKAQETRKDTYKAVSVCIWLLTCLLCCTAGGMGTSRPQRMERWFPFSSMRVSNTAEWKKWKESHLTVLCSHLVSITKPRSQEMGISL